MKKISIVTPCYNEEGNVEELYSQVAAVLKSLPQYDYEHIFIDNCSLDKTPQILRELANKDKRVKVIFNARNFGHIRSPYYGTLQATGDAVILMVSDLQDPPKMILDFIKKWEEGYKVVLGVKEAAEESTIFYNIRKAYYKLVNRLSNVQLTNNNTGFGLYDQKVIQVMRELGDVYPYFRGLVSEIGFESFKIPYKQPVRKRGITKNNFYTLYDIAMLGITSHSKIPLRIATILGFILAFISFILGLGYLVAKLMFWNYFEMGLAPVLIGIFFFSSFQLFFIGILGEYIGAIHTQVQKRPLVVERERLNF